MAKRKRLSPARLADIPAPEVKSALPRGPLAPRAPIAEVAHDAAAAAALAEVADEMQAARGEGRLILRLPLAAVVADYLVRDRAAMDPGDLAVLVDSLRARGQQTAIEVADLGDGRYGLISGYRRLTALRQLQADAVPGDATRTVLAIIRQPAQAAEAYQAMVEENEIRVGLSFYERGRIVVRATDAGVYPSDRVALARLFAAVPRARRSKIGSFVGLVRACDGVLRHPTGLSEKLGLALARAVEDAPDLPARLAAALDRAGVADAAQEAAVISTLIASANDAGPEAGQGVGTTAEAPPQPKTTAPAPAPDGGADRPADSHTAPPAPARPQVAPIDLGNGVTVFPDAGLDSILVKSRRLTDPDFVDRLLAALRSLN